MLTSEPLYYTAKPYGCTCTILFEEYKRFGHEIDREEAILMASAIISDTLLLKSPTATEQGIFMTFIFYGRRNRKILIENY